MSTSSSNSLPPRLPPRPNLEFLRKLAKDRLAQTRATNPESKLHQSQLTLAREHGFPSWRALVAHLTPTATTAQLLRTATRTEITGIPTLSWQHDTPVTFIGALAAALKAIDPAHDVATLMGDSALAFRIRYWSADDFTRSCPSGPVGEFAPWTTLAANSIGWKIRWEADFHDQSAEHPATPNDPSDMNGFAGEVLAHLDAGRPVLAYINGWDLGILYGYDTSSASLTTLLARDYYIHDNEKNNTTTFQSLRGLLAFFEDQHPTPTRTQSIITALTQATTDWSTSPERNTRHNRPGAYYLGRSAYPRWQQSLEHSLTTDPDDEGGEGKQNLLHVHHWTYVSLLAARKEAAPYLRAAKPHLPPTTHSHLDSAAAAAEALVAFLEEKNNLFPPFYLPNASSTFPPETRQAAITAIQQIAALDATLHLHLQKALTS